jgi:hypothetical protein
VEKLKKKKKSTVKRNKDIKKMSYDPAEGATDEVDQ